MPSENDLPKFSWNEIRRHTSVKDRWIVVDGKVYDVTNWQNKHPGGRKIIGHFAGQDATGLFDAKIWWFMFMLIQVVAFEVAAYFNLYYFGSRWIPFVISVCLYTIAQTQASWLQHDFGHLSVFKTTKMNHLFHELTMGLIKGTSCHWWNHMHNQHHAKPNIIDKDPDTRLEPMFVIGGEQTKRAASKGTEWKWHMPYAYQHKYFFLIGPPLLFPIYFQFTSTRHMIIRRCYEDAFWVCAFWTKLFALYAPLLGFRWTLCYFFIVRLLESHWFTWVSQSNHIPMEVDYDKEEPWFLLQLKATCNIQHSLFNDWFTGHLNFQLEHHLFPTMPRHNYIKAQPEVMELCKELGYKYECKEMGVAFKDIVRALKSSADTWQEEEKANSKAI